jgi:hypothetical protein
MSINYTGRNLTPGMPSNELLTQENNITWGRLEQAVIVSGVIDKDSVDTGNTADTSILRPGLAVGRIRATGQITHWNPYATDGSQQLVGFLIEAQAMSYMGAASERLVGNILAGGNVKAGSVLIAPEGTIGLTESDYQILLRNQCEGRFLFDDDLGAYTALKTRELTGNVSLTVADHRTHFTNLGAGGAVTATLPVPLPGLEFIFTSVAAHNIVLEGPATGEYFSPSGNSDTLLPANDETVVVRTIRTAATPTYQYVLSPIPAN